MEKEIKTHVKAIALTQTSIEEKVDLLTNSLEKATTSQSAYEAILLEITNRLVLVEKQNELFLRLRRDEIPKIVERYLLQYFTEMEKTLLENILQELNAKIKEIS